MARIRTIKPEFFQSDTVSQLPYRTRLVFIGLWTHCDDAGRCKDHARLIKAALFPLEDDVTAAMVEADLNALALAGVILRYEAMGERYIAVRAWAEHQKINRPSPSKYPEPSEGSPTPPAPLTVDSLNVHGGLSEPSRTEVEVEVEVEREREVLAEPSPTTPTLVLVPPKATDKPSRQRNPLWDALTEEIGPAVTPTELSRRGKTVAELKAAGATPEQIHERANVYRSDPTFRTCRLTDRALASNWSSLAQRHSTRPALSANSEAFLRVMAAAEEADRADAMSSLIDVTPIGELA